MVAYFLVPALLISSTIILAVLRSGSPKNEAGPDTENNAPILMGGAAKAAPAEKDRNNIERTIQKSFFDINPSISQYITSLPASGQQTAQSIIIMRSVTNKKPRIRSPRGFFATYFELSQCRVDRCRAV